MNHVQERAHKVKALMQKGHKAAPWSMEKVREVYAQEFGEETTPETKPEPAPEPKPQPKPQPKPEPTPEPNNSELAARMAELLSAFGGTGGVSESRIIELIKEHSNSRAITIKNERRESEVYIERTHEAFRKVLGVLQCGLNAYLFGPAGTGKTTIAEQCAEALGLEFYFTGAVLQKYELLGFVDAGGTYQRTAFRDAFENGGVFLFDEKDASAAQALIAFNAAIANGVCAFPDKIIKKHPDFLVIAASNTNGQGATDQYLRNKLDAATLDRYVFVAVNYDLELERALAAGYGDIGTQWCANVQKLRELASAHQIGELITPRATMQGCELLAGGNFSFAEVENMTIYSKMSEDNASALRSAAR